MRSSASGRKARYLGWHAIGIVGMSQVQGYAALDGVCRLPTKAKYIYPWRRGDLVIWDNRCTVHGARPYDRFRHKRDCRRATINGYEEA